MHRQQPRVSQYALPFLFRARPDEEPTMLRVTCLSLPRGNAKSLHRYARKGVTALISPKHCFWKDQTRPGAVAEWLKAMVC
jgi:hypothetical protein